jgi:hypothetical protein
LFHFISHKVDKTGIFFMVDELVVIIFDRITDKPSGQIAACIGKFNLCFPMIIIELIFDQRLYIAAGICHVLLEKCLTIVFVHRDVYLLLTVCVFHS